MPVDITSKRFTLLVHFIFWAVYFLLNGTAYTKFVGLGTVAWKVIFSGLIHMGLVYINLLILLPVFFLRGRYKTYIALMVPLFFAAVIGLLLVETNWFSGSRNPLDIIAPGYFRPDLIISAFLSTFLVLSLTALLTFLQEWYKQQEQMRKMALEQLQAEHRMLRMQVSPHFLFNALNNIYSLVYTQSEKAAPSVLQLAHLMRYQLYETGDKTVPLEKEAGYIENFIALQELKIDDADQKIRFEYGGLEGVNIEPLLFIPFVENAFKHGNLQDKGGFLHISLIADDELIRFHLENSVEPGNDRKDAVGGVGMENVRNRLEAYYPHAHELELKESAHLYSVSLTIRR